ncbi:MAG TPA: heavy metal-associated domain-containing protein [Limnochordales bacterium]|uniref:Copper chaperone CopZ n=1 Tax=Geochorda subterranea TaxID=3109564 RepID=A0ABZ1BQ52_9FIRM|nr:heavy metal-associated domain-containing protein [Limnochorda sp. LNt]WRP14922.1 heavy metal-associated domain-containing protein [Limnochorda sp. LNt]
MVREIFELSGLHCPSCVSRIERAVRAIRGVHEAKVAFAAGLLTVEYDPAVTASESITHAVTQMGYPARTLRREQVG